MQSLEEKKEQVIIQYMRSYDLDVAMMKVGLTSDEQKLLKNDTSFMYRVNFQDATLKEDIVTTMIDNMKNGDPKLSQTAAIALGGVMWPEKFKAKGDEKPNHIIPDQIILTGED